MDACCCASIQKANELEMMKNGERGMNKNMDQNPVTQAPIGQALMGQASMGQPPTGQIPMGEAPITQAPMATAAPNALPVVYVMQQT